MSAPTICRYCNRVELVFDNAYKSKTGKLIPLDKTSGMPHQCSDNPYVKQYQEQNNSNSTTVPNPSNTNGLVGTELILFQITQLSKKFDRVITLLEDERRK